MSSSWARFARFARCYEKGEWRGFGAIIGGSYGFIKSALYTGMFIRESDASVTDLSLAPVLVVAFVPTVIVTYTYGFLGAVPELGAIYAAGYMWCKKWNSE